MALPPAPILTKKEETHEKPSLDTAMVDSGQSQNPVPGPPPNGGLRAWLQVVGAFCIFLNTWYAAVGYSSTIFLLPVLQGNRQHVRCV